MSGTNILAQNGLGIFVYSNGRIAISNLTAIGNGVGFGAYLDNHTASTPQPVTLTGTNEFKFNNIGLAVLSQGAITLNNVAANGSVSGNGAFLKNDYNFASSVILNGVSTFNDNGGYGLVVYSLGAITTRDLTASGNGLVVGGGYGTYIDNADAASPKPVTLNGINTFTGNDGTGLSIYSIGAIKISNLTANDNGHGTTWGRGADLDNCAWDGGEGCTAPAPMPITLVGYVQLNDNQLHGMWADSNGAIITNNVTATGNGGHGLVTAGLVRLAASGSTVPTSSTTMAGTGLRSSAVGVSSPAR